MDLFNLKGKTILITAGAGHLGTAMSEALAGYGADLVISTRDYDKGELLAAKLREKFDAPVSVVCIDTDSSESIQKGIEEVIKVHGKIDVLINNAAHSCAGYFEDLTDEMWKNVMDGTINGVFRMCSAVIPFMSKQGYGNIINISSMYGQVAPNPKAYHGEVRFNNPACYGAGKAAIIQLTKYLAAYYGEKGIRCNAIAPGPFPSKYVQETQWFIDELADRTMLKRIGKPEDLQGTVILLASDASSFITGQTFSVNGGWTSW